MNILHMKYAVEVAKAGSLNKASETLLGVYIWKELLKSETKEEYELYAGALLAARKWGRNVNKSKKHVSEEKFLKERYNK